MRPTQATHQFRIALVEAMRKRGVTSTALAKAMNVSHSAVRFWVNGKTMPTYSNISILAEELESMAIARFGHKAYERTCEFCSKPYVITELRYGASKTCSSVCSRKKKSAGVPARKEIPVMNAVADFCRTECPFGESGSCRNSACHLAPFTPLPFAEPNMQTPTNRRPWTHEERQKRSEWSKKYYADKENRDRQAQRTREALAGLSNEQKTAHRQSISKFYAKRRETVD